LKRWAEKYACRWLKNKNYRDIVYQSLKEEEGMLPTLLNISSFASATRPGGPDEGNIVNADHLKTVIRKYSQSIPSIFKTTIEKALDDELVFLCFPFITEELQTDKVKEFYTQFAKQLSENNDIRINSNDPYLFESIISRFKYEVDTSAYVRFRHPSYSQTLPLVLVDESDLPRGRFNDIFCKIFVKLADSYVAKRSIASTLNKVFDKLPPQISNKMVEDLCITAENMMCNAQQFRLEPFQSGSSWIGIRRLHTDANQLYWEVISILENHCKKTRQELLLRMRELPSKVVGTY
jgi:hypothetical protein